jgi:hypothetical protein
MRRLDNFTLFFGGSGNRGKRNNTIQENVRSPKGARVIT